FQRGSRLTATNRPEQPTPSGQRSSGEIAAATENRSDIFGSVIGVSCTASLASARPKKGDHRCHVATQSAGGTSAYSLVMQKGARDRVGEERLVGQLILHALARAAGLPNVPCLKLMPNESVLEEHVTAAPLLVELLAGLRGI